MPGMQLTTILTQYIRAGTIIDNITTEIRPDRLYIHAMRANLPSLAKVGQESGQFETFRLVATYLPVINYWRKVAYCCCLSESYRG